MNKKEKCSVTQVGRIVIHKGDIEKRIYKTELEKYLLDNWSLGISEKHKEELSKSKIGKEPWNKGTKGIMKSNSGSFKKGCTPWIKGKKGVTTAWNKGLTKETDPRVIGHSMSDENKLKLQKRMMNNTINVGRKYSEEQCLHISQSKMGHTVSEETRKKISNHFKGKHIPKEKLLIKLSKEHETKKLNGTFNTSKPEDNLYNQLLKSNGNKTIYRQYKDINRYPFYCDFYILEDDLFIELNLHWTHGGRPYDPNDIECQEKLKIWQEKAKTSQFYKQAIYIWTDLDVKKAEIARKNNLNYKVIY